MTTVFPVQPNGWQPVNSEDTITIGSTTNLVMKNYVIHFGPSGEDLYAFFDIRNAPLQVALAKTTLTVTGTISYIRRIEKDAEQENTYNTVDSRLSFDDTITGGLQLVQRFIIIINGYGGSNIFGKTMLSGSSYNNNNKYVYVTGDVRINIDLSNYDMFFKNDFTIMPLPALTSTITPNTNTLYITKSAINFKTSQVINIINDELPQNFTIGGSTGITVSGFTQNAASGTDNHLVIQLYVATSKQIHGRTAPIIRFIAGTNTATVEMKNNLIGFIEPVSVVKNILYRFLAGKSGTPGIVSLDAINLAKITFDTTSKITIPEVSDEPVLTELLTDTLYQLNKEAIDVPAKDVYYISFAIIDKSVPETPKLATLTATPNDTKYDIVSNDAVYIVRFKLGEESEGKFPASAQVVGKLLNAFVTYSFNKIPLELTQLGNVSKHQLPYINIGNGSTVL